MVQSKRGGWEVRGKAAVNRTQSKRCARFQVIWQKWVVPGYFRLAEGAWKEA